MIVFVIRMVCAWPLSICGALFSWASMKVLGARDVVRAGIVYHPAMGYGVRTTGAGGIHAGGAWHEDVDAAEASIRFHMNAFVQREKERVTVEGEHV